MKSRVQPPVFGPAHEPGAELFAARRKRFLDRIGDGVAVVGAAPELLKSRDTEIRYRPSSDLYYLTGFLEPEAVAVISRHQENDLTLFVRERDPAREAWVGPRLGVERAAEVAGARAFPIAELANRIPELLRPADRIYYEIGEGGEVEAAVLAAIATSRRLRPRSGKGPTGLADLEPVLAEMRLIKDAHEIERLRIAADIAAAGHIAAMEAARPGAGEWEIQAALEGMMRRLGAEGPSFPSIVASGPNATTLHYVDNRRIVAENDLVLVDAGAEWGMYCSDITRTFPASGRFNAEQADLYDVILAAERAAIAAAQPGARCSEVHEAAARVLTQGMLDLHILPTGGLDEAIESGAYKRFYLHQTSHWLGLDVHDAGPYVRDGESIRLEPGMLLTVEPGIYIPAGIDDVPEPYRGVGIRLEDDVFITDVGNEVITGGVPIDREAVEAILGGE